MFLRDYWYVAAWSHEIGRALFQRTILGEPVLLYRTEAGTAVALHDKCPHRRAPLSYGRLIGDEVQCGYHGMRFGPDGGCTHIPGQERIPAQAAARRYPLVERHGFAWIWTGAPAKADPTCIPDYHWQTDPAWTGGGVLIETKSNALLLAENVLDLSHAAYLHASTVGAEYVAYIEPETIVEGDRVKVRRLMYGVKNPPSFVKILGFEDCDREQVIHFWAPSFIVLEINVWKAGTARNETEVNMRVLSPVTPESEASHHQYLCFYRNFELDDPKLTELMVHEIHTAAKEDTWMLEAQQRMMDDDPPGQPLLNLKVDKGPLAARRMIERLERKATKTAKTTVRAAAE